jgi:hypothetical protein
VVTYCYTCPASHTTERTFRHAEDRSRWIRCPDCGRRSRRDIAADFKGQSVEQVWEEPLISNAAGIHPSQISEFREMSKKAGCPTEFTETGAAILTSRGHRRAFMKFRQMHDNDGGYGDA